MYIATADDGIMRWQSSMLTNTLSIQKSQHTTLPAHYPIIRHWYILITRLPKLLNNPNSPYKQDKVIQPWLVVGIERTNQNSFFFFVFMTLIW